MISWKNGLSSEAKKRFELNGIEAENERYSVELSKLDIQCLYHVLLMALDNEKDMDFRQHYIDIMHAFIEKVPIYSIPES